MKESLPSKKCTCNLTPFVLCIALGTHSLFEGLAAGLQRDLTGVLNMFLAIFIHKSAAALSLGISLVKTFPDDFTMVRWLVFIFSIATPIGVIAGMMDAPFDAA